VRAALPGQGAPSTTRISRSASSPGYGGRRARPREAQAKRPMHGPTLQIEKLKHRRGARVRVSPSRRTRSSRTETRTPWTWPRTVTRCTASLPRLMLLEDGSSSGGPLQPPIACAHGEPRLSRRKRCGHWVTCAARSTASLSPCEKTSVPSAWVSTNSRPAAGGLSFSIWSVGPA